MPSRAAVAACAASALSATVLAVPAAPASAAPYRWTRLMRIGADNPWFPAEIQALGRNDIWLFTDASQEAAESVTPRAHHWNGASWTEFPVPSRVKGLIGQISAGSAKDIWAEVWSPDSSYEGVLHWNGKAWSEAGRLSSGLITTGIVAFGKGRARAFSSEPGRTETVTFRDGSATRKTWRGRELLAPAGTAPNDVWALGLSKRSPVFPRELQRFDGTKWREVVPPASVLACGGKKCPPSSYGSIVAASKKSVFVTYDLSVESANGEPLKPRWRVLHWNGKAWKRLGKDHRYWLHSAVSDRAGGLWAVEQNPDGGSTVVHLDKKGKLTRYPYRADPSGLRYPGLTVAKDGTVFATAAPHYGSDGARYVWRLDR
ncbi:hypothetical protein EDD29_6991 [Actinocorallia herbida]|uniref:BNR repeat neuraminidase n=1 Tax=Actinocorallia herbida TaxID=58109 RepID=A0A3N1D6Z5_9ACTN|nr:hypothetical protein [Actinocorallia herbida]ROO89302.1 hypothetical protein EDD29_6991 [Actinocorallia herbida]